MKQYFILSMTLIGSSLWGECKEEDLYFSELRNSIKKIEEINDKINKSAIDSDQKVISIVEKNQTVDQIQQIFFKQFIQNTLSSKDPRVCDKLLSVLKLLELSNMMKQSSDKESISNFEEELINLKQLLSPEGVCPKIEKNPRRYKIDEYL